MNKYKRLTGKQYSSDILIHLFRNKMSTRQLGFAKKRNIFPTRKYKHVTSATVKETRDAVAVIWTLLHPTPHHTDGKRRREMMMQFRQEFRSLHGERIVKLYFYPKSCHNNYRPNVTPFLKGHQILPLRHRDCKRDIASTLLPRFHSNTFFKIVLYSTSGVPPFVSKPSGHPTF